MASSRDVDRFYRLLWPHRETVLRTARLLVRDRNNADDLAQETMLKGFRSIRQFADDTNARAWLLTILRNVRIDWLRSEARRQGDVSLDASNDLGDRTDLNSESRTNIDSVDDLTTLLERLGDADLIDALHTLPEEIRWTMLLVEVEGMDHADVARVLDVPIGTIKSRASRGRSMLRTSLEPIAQSRGWNRHAANVNANEAGHSEFGGTR